jgi:hypothetical protein
VAWWDSAFIQTLTGAFAAIGGAFVGAWWSGRAKARTAKEDRLAQADMAAEDRRVAREEAREDRLHTANIASMDRLHGNRAETIERISACTDEATSVHLICFSISDRMKKAVDNEGPELFVEALTEFQRDAVPAVNALWTQVEKITLRTALYIDPPSAHRLDKTFKQLKDRKFAINKTFIRGFTGTENNAELRRRAASWAEDHVVFVHTAELHLNRVLLVLAKVTNPDNAPWFERQYGALDK